MGMGGGYRGKAAIGGNLILYLSLMLGRHGILKTSDFANGDNLLSLLSQFCFSSTEKRKKTCIKFSSKMDFEKYVRHQLFYSKNIAYSYQYKL